jgi:hypothetical protein
MADPKTSPRLTILGGRLSGRELTLDEAVDNILIGSDASCRFHLDAPSVSPIHARLWVDWQGVTVYDTGAPEGVYLNDDRVERSAPVRNGDILWLGPPGGDDVVMIQCRVPPRAGTPPPVSLPVIATADAAATLVSGSDTPAPAEGFTETVALGPAPEPTPVVEVAQETLWLTPDAADEAPVAETVALAPEPAAAAPYVEPFELPADDDFAASTVVLHAGDETVTASPVSADATPDLASEEPVKFEIDEPPPVLTPVQPIFEDDIEDPAALEAPTRLDTPPAVEAAPATVVSAPARVTPPAPPAPPPVVREVPPAPRPAPAVVAPPPAPVSAPRPAPASKPTAGGSSAGKWATLAAVALLLVVVGLFAVYRFVLAPTPSPQGAPPLATPPPATLAQGPEVAPAPVEVAPTPIAEASVAPIEESVTIVKAQPSPAAPTPTPRATAAGSPTPGPAVSTPAPVAPVDPRAQASAQAAALVGQGDAALAEQRYDAAVAAYTQALQADPGNAQASAGRARAQAAAADARRTFVSGRSVLVGARSGKKGPAGFDAEDVAVAKSPDYSGRLEFEAGLRSVKAGDGWSVRVFLVNDGKKDFKVQNLAASLSVNGAKSPLPATAGVREVPTQKRAQVAEFSGIWREGTSAWSLEVALTSTHGEVVRNTLTWR